MAKEEPATPVAVAQNVPDAKPGTEKVVSPADTPEGTEGRRKKRQPAESYEEYFLRNSEETARYGKMIT